MKKLVYILGLTLSCFSFSSCHTEQDTVKENIKNYFIENLNDPTTYEPVSYGEIESCPSCMSIDSVPYDKSIRFTYRKIITSLESGIQFKKLIKVEFYLDSKLNIVSVVDFKTKSAYNINRYSH